MMSSALSRALVGAIATLALVGCTAQPPAAPAEDFSTSSGTARECAVRGDQTGVAGELVWSVDIHSESWSTPLVVGATSYIGANDGLVRALNTDTGEEQWSFATTGAVRSEVLYDGDALYVASDDGKMYALTLDGSVIWSAEIGSGDRSDEFFNYGSRAEVAGSMIIAASGNGVVHALDRATGESKWSFDTLGPIQTNVAIGGGLAYIASDYGTIYALDLASGEEAWSRSTSRAATTHPAYSDGVLVVGSRSTVLLGLDAATGDELWQAKYGTSWVQSGATIVDDAVITGSSDIGQVRAYVTATGEPLWTTDIGGWAWGTPVACDDVLYTTSMRPSHMQPWEFAVHALAVADGSVVWQAGTGPGIEWQPDGLAIYGVAASPAVASNTIIVPGLDGVVYGFRR